MNNLNIMQILNQIKQNPVDFVIRSGFNIPDTVNTDPNSIIQHLMNTGQVSQHSYNNAVNMAQQILGTKY